MSTPLLQQFPALASYPPSFLKDLLSSPELLEAFLYSLPHVQDLVGEVETLARDNDTLARRNLVLRDELVALREATAHSYGHAEALKQRWAELEKAQTNVYQRQRPSFLHLRLRHSLTAQDDASEKLASTFIEGGESGISASASGPASRVDSPAPGGAATDDRVERVERVGDRGRDRALDEFIAQFKEARKTYHKRAIWAERWSRGEVAWRDD